MVSPIELAAIAGAAILLFGAERLPKLARSAGEMRREFIRGQADAETESQASPTVESPATLPTITANVAAEAKDHEQHRA